MMVVSVSVAPRRRRNERSNASSSAVSRQEDLGHRLEPGGGGREPVGVGARRQGHAHQRLDSPPARRRVDGGHEAGDHSGSAQAPYAGGGGVGAEAHGGPQVAP